MGGIGSGVSSLAAPPLPEESLGAPSLGDGLLDALPPDALDPLPLPEGSLGALSDPGAAGTGAPALSLVDSPLLEP
jgi:hypothetical protein